MAELDDLRLGVDSLLKTIRRINKELEEVASSLESIEAKAECFFKRLDPDIQKKLDTEIAYLELSVRPANCLELVGIRTVGELIVKTEEEMLKYRNFGSKSLNELKDILREMGLSFGMTFDSEGRPVKYD